MRIRLAVALSFVLFVVLAGGGAAQAYWLSQVSASSTVQVASLASNCTPATRLTNGSFESPVIPAGSYRQGAVAPWSTTDSRGVELWPSGFEGVTAQVGNQFVELNAESAGTLWQDIATTPGQTIRWSLLHRARVGTDTMRVSLGAVGNTGGVSQGTYSATTASWTRHEGTYTVPAGQTTTRFSMTAVSTGSGNPTIGNFIDDVSFGSGPCLTAVSTVANTTRSSGTPRIGDELLYTTTVKNTGGSPALAAALSSTLPAGIEFKAGSLTIDNAAMTDAGGDDQAHYLPATRQLGARLGLNASATAGGSIAPDQSIFVSFRALVTAAAVGSTVDYAAAVGYTDFLAPGWPQSTTAAPVGFTVVAADLAVAVLSTPTITPGSTATWTFSVTNNGPSTAPTANVSVTIPAGVTNATVVRTTANDGTGSQACAGTPRTCVLGALNSGDTRKITLSGTVSAVQPSYSSTATVSTTSYDHVSGNDAATNVATLSDTLAPSTPVGLSASGTTETQTTVAWDASTDNMPGVISYDIFRDGLRIATTTSLEITDTGLTAGATYSYTVVAVDAALNRSDSSFALKVTTIQETAWYRIGHPEQASTCIGTTSSGNHASLQLVDCTPVTFQNQWRFVGMGDGYFNVVARYDARRMWETNSTNVRVSQSAGTADDQKWSPVTRTVGGVSYVGFMNRAGDCLSAQAVGNQLVRATCANTQAQSFLLTRVP